MSHHQGHQVTSGPPPGHCSMLAVSPPSHVGSSPRSQQRNSWRDFKVPGCRNSPCTHSSRDGQAELELSLCSPTWPQGWVCVLLWVQQKEMSPLAGDTKGAAPSRVWGKLGNFSSKNREGFVYQDLHPEFCGGRESWMKPTAIAVTSENK